MYENGLKHLLQNLSNLVCLGDDFRRFSHPNAQNLAQSRNSQIVCVTWVFSSEAGKCQHLPVPTQLFHEVVSMGIRGGAGRRGEAGEGFCAVLLCLEGRASLFWGREAPSCGFSLVGAEWSPWVGAGLSALLCHWGRWRPARAWGKDEKGRVASEFGDSCASLLGACPRSWVGVSRARDPCEVSVAEVQVCRECEIPGVLLPLNKPEFSLKTAMGMCTLPCLRC